MPNIRLYCSLCTRWFIAKVGSMTITAATSTPLSHAFSPEMVHCYTFAFSFSFSCHAILLPLNIQFFPLYYADVFPSTRSYSGDTFDTPIVCVDCHMNGTHDQRWSCLRILWVHILGYQFDNISILVTGNKNQSLFTMGQFCSMDKNVKRKQNIPDP